MLLTAMAVGASAAVILADPIFQGLAIFLMAGHIACLFITRMAVPVLYYMAARKQAAKAAADRSVAGDVTSIPAATPVTLARLE
jgi:hypothetical protein